MLTRVAWMPFNVGVFIIIFASMIILGILAIGVLEAIPLIFVFYGIWLIVESFFFSPTGAYAPPRIMIIGWGGLLLALGLVWFVGVYYLPLVPIVLAVLVLAAGISIVGYSLLRAQRNRPGPTTPATSS